LLAIRLRPGHEWSASADLRSVIDRVGKGELYDVNDILGLPPGLLMGSHGMDLEQLMERLSRSGVTVVLKVDDERMTEGGKPWTLVMSGPGLGEQGFIRAESSSLSDCLDRGFARLRSRPLRLGMVVDY
jgi:hypothetical protein